MLFRSNIREMALNEDTSSYDNYEQTVKRLLSEVDSELQILKKTEVLSDENYEDIQRLFLTGEKLVIPL